MKKIVIWYAILDGGDGSAYPKFFLLEDRAEIELEAGEGCDYVNSLETFEGSDVHIEALQNEKIRHLKDDIVEIIFDGYLPEKTKKPAIQNGEKYKIEGIVHDSKGNQHLNLGLKSNLKFVTSFETGEKLVGGDKIHYVNPMRVKSLENEEISSE